uniref:Uncharacterized protein n=2 Tax=Setaria TaxID=4554 RepID=K3ZYP4_SETIT|nr:hypothetical protein SEVIR_2G216601v2 [Setaria viridis]
MRIGIFSGYQSCYFRLMLLPCKMLLISGTTATFEASTGEVIHGRLLGLPFYTLVHHSPHPRLRQAQLQQLLLRRGA